MCSLFVGAKQANQDIRRHMILTRIISDFIRSGFTVGSPTFNHPRQISGESSTITPIPEKVSCFGKRNSKVCWVNGYGCFAALKLRTPFFRIHSVYSEKFSQLLVNRAPAGSIPVSAIKRFINFRNLPAE
jgi:hypothetical protein